VKFGALVFFSASKQTFKDLHNDLSSRASLVPSVDS
jgi:hypothetical protein